MSKVLCVVAAAFLLAACGPNITASIDDATLTTRVKTALLNDPQVGGMRIDVDTAAGVVTLSGTVKSAADEQQAIAVARHVSGVRDVKSTLQIRPATSDQRPATGNQRPATGNRRRATSDWRSTSP